MKVSEETKKTIQMIQDFLIELQAQEYKESQKNGEFSCSGHLGNMIFKLNQVKHELGIEKDK